MSPSRLRPFLLAAVLALAPAVTGCAALKEPFLSGDTITYEQYLRVDENDEPTVDQVLARLGEPASVEDRDGRRFKLVYNAYTMFRKLGHAEFVFDKDEVLRKKTLR